MIPSSYLPHQVTCLLSRYEGPVLDLETKEVHLREGAYYGDLLSWEALPDPAYLAIFDRQNATLAARLAPWVIRLADQIHAARPGHAHLALASIARAGTPIGVVLADVLRQRHGRRVTHYSVSAIHKYGLDRFALRHMLDRHAPGALVFLDGWVSQGRITRTLQESLVDRPDIDATLFCLSDPSGIQDATATREDILLPSAVLNAAVSGLLSRTVQNPEGFHACLYYADHAPVDRTQAFIDTLLAAVARCPGPDTTPIPERTRQRAAARAQLDAWCAQHETTPDDTKAGLGEVSRSLLRRSPRRVQVDPSAVPEAEHLFHLAHVRQVPIEVVPLRGPYRAFSALT